MLQFQTPAPWKLPGILHLETSLESQAYQTSSVPGGVLRQQRFRTSAALSDWLTGWLRWKGGAAVDRIASATYVGMDGSLTTRSFNDHVSLNLDGHLYSSGTADPFANGELTISMRSTTTPDVPTVTALAGIAVASTKAPLAVWPGASTGSSRIAQIRAHELLRDGIVAGDVFGRQLVFASAEYVHPMPTRVGLVGIAGFVDAAQATSRLDSPNPSPFHVDIGGGLRFNTSRAGNMVRLDVGYGLRDGHVRVSAGYVQPWGKR
jgi:hypothetical protein